MRALTFVIGALLQLVVTVFLLRVLLPLARADSRNQLSQAVIRLTNRVVLPLRKMLPPMGKLDTASFVALVLVQLIATGILWSLRQYPWVLTPPQFFLVALGSLLGTVLMFYTFAMVLYVLLSWIAPGTYSPASALVSSLCEPLLAPVRRVIPALGGIDFSALFVIIALQALYIATNEYLLTPGY
jgi:YggT family protein